MSDLPEVPLDYISQCLRNNEFGDAELFAALHRDRFLYVENTDQWLEFTGHYWDRERPGRARNAVGDCAMQYVRLLEAKQYEKKNAPKEAEKPGDGYLKDIERRIDRMRSKRGIEHTLALTATLDEPLAVRGDEFDRYPLLLPVANGVVDLETGALREGNPRDYLMRHCSCPYMGIDAPAPRWQAFLSDIFRNDAEKVEFFQTALGYALTGLTTDQYLFCLTGAGANGKNVLMETLHEVLGEFFWAADPEIFLERKYTKSPGAPNAEMASLRGRRFVSLQEIAPNRKVDLSAVKRLTGSDTVTCRSPHDKYEINYQPTAKFFLSFNDRPKGLAKDFAMLRRLIYLDLPLRFVRDPEHEKRRDPQNADLYRQRDPDLRKKLMDELPGILASLVRSCLRWQKHGLNPPASVIESAEAIAREEDWMGRFLDESCEQNTESYLEMSLFYEAFSEWFKNEVDENPNRCPSKRWVMDKLRKAGFTIQRSNNVSRVFGLCLL